VRHANDTVAPPDPAIRLQLPRLRGDAGRRHPTAEWLVPPAFAALAAATISLLIISLRNSWDLLVNVGEAIMAREADPDSPPLTACR
jgi:hypothetical protein